MSSLDIPVFPTITATVTFQEFRYDEFDSSIFTIPDDYKEDPSRFPDLWLTQKVLPSNQGKQENAETSEVNPNRRDNVFREEKGITFFQHISNMI